MTQPPMGHTMGLLSSQNLPRYVILSFGYAGPLHLLKFLANLNYERQVRPDLEHFVH